MGEVWACVDAINLVLVWDLSKIFQKLTDTFDLHQWDLHPLRLVWEFKTCFEVNITLTLALNVFLIVIHLAGVFYYIRAILCPILN